VPPSNVIPRRRHVLEPTSAHTSSTTTTVDSSLLGRPGKPIGWNTTTRLARGSAEVAVGSDSIADSRSATSPDANGS
jgi:hypothetical protein